MILVIVMKKPMKNNMHKKIRSFSLKNSIKTTQYLLIVCLLYYRYWLANKKEWRYFVRHCHRYV
jgi:capsule polysaccharide export protein KpsE/RkpR